MASDERFIDNELQLRSLQRANRSNTLVRVIRELFIYLDTRVDETREMARIYPDIYARIAPLQAVAEEIAVLERELQYLTEEQEAKQQ